MFFKYNCGIGQNLKLLKFITKIHDRYMLNKEK